MNTISAPISEKSTARKIIYSLTPFSLLDYPDKSSCILWFAGCNMRCSYCYNPKIVFGKGNIATETAISFLQTRKQLLDAVVFSGGECTLYPEIIPIAETIKKMGFCIKVDTNGSNPDRLSNLIALRLVDYIALDFKAPATKFQEITKSAYYFEFIRSLHILIASKLPFEVRTTWHSDLLNETDLQEMVSVLEEISYTGNFYVQFFRNGIPTIADLKPSTPQENLEQFSTQKLKIKIRGMIY